MRFPTSVPLMVLALALACPARADTLADAIATAYESNPQLLAQRASTRATDETYVQARAAYGPTLNATASRTYSRSDRRFVTPLGPARTRDDGYSDSYGLTLSQPLYTSGRLRAQLSFAEAGIEFARQTLRLAEADLLSEVISAYVAVRRDIKLLAIAQENYDLLNRQYGDTDARFRVRETTQTDLSQTENRLAFARAQLLESRGALEVSRGRYLAAVGRPPVDLAPEPDLRNLPMSIEQAYDVAEGSNAELLAAQFRERGSRASLAGARAERGPNVSLEGSAFRTLPRDFTGSQPEERQTEYVARGVVSVPLFSSGLVSSRIREAVARNDQDWRLIDQARRTVRQQVASAWDQLVATRSSLDPYAQAVRAAEQAFAGAREQERVGARATIEVLDQARDLLTSRTAYAQAQANEYLSRVALLRAMGLLEAPLLFAEVKAYDPVEHFRKVRNLGGLPLITPVLSTIDGALNPNLKKPREPRDPAATVRKEGSGPLPPTPPVEQKP